MFRQLVSNCFTIYARFNKKPNGRNLLFINCINATKTDIDFRQRSRLDVFSVSHPINAEAKNILSSQLVSFSISMLKTQIVITKIKKNPVPSCFLFFSYKKKNPQCPTYF